MIIDKPVLIIAPSAIILNWEREARIWASDLNPLVYYGYKDSRDVIYNKEFFYNNGQVIFYQKIFILN